jgi:hypothetical protein
MSERFVKKQILLDEDCSEFTDYVNKHKKIRYNCTSGLYTVNISQYNMEFLGLGSFLHIPFQCQWHNLKDISYKYCSATFALYDISLLY